MIMAVSCRIGVMVGFVGVHGSVVSELLRARGVMIMLVAANRFDEVGYQAPVDPVMARYRQDLREPDRHRGLHGRWRP